MMEMSRVRSLGQVAPLPNQTSLYAWACDSCLRRTASEVDALIDVSGFAYGDALGLVGFSRVRPLVEYCWRHGRPAIFLPQAWGSFRKPQVRMALRGLLSGASTRFYARDEQSCRHLQSALGRPTGSIKPRPDVTFRFQGASAWEGERTLRGMGCSKQRPIVGVAPNMRVYERTAGEGGDNRYVQALTSLVRHCVDNHDVDVVFQANEIDTRRRRVDDRYLCRLIGASVDRPGRCFLTQEPLSAEKTKALIGHFEYLIGSRFHSLVFAFCQGVPAMAIGWSHKYRELFSLFGMKDEVHESGEVDVEDLVSTFERGWSQRHLRRPAILAQVRQLQAEADALFDEVAAAVREGQRR